jgi:Tol biopolymer transport system component/predicted Ser/Thr protein kinase
MDESRLQPGSRLAHYQVLAKAGEGGSGFVYRVQDTKLNRTAALKVLRWEAEQDPAVRRRFMREAEAASALNHPNIVTIYEVGEADGLHYIAMEHIEGRTLRETFRQGKLDVEATLRIAVQIADALHAAHSAGIVHRDLKPGNIMVTGDGHVKILDFGLAKPGHGMGASGADDITKSVALTREGVLLGTFAYMSPEQAEGKPVDGRSDIFAFGCVLYEMLARQRAFEGGSSVSTLAAVIHKEPQPLRELEPSLPAGLDWLVARCLKKDPKARWQNIGDVKIVLERLLAEKEEQIAAAMPQSRGKRIARYSAAALAGALLAAGAGWTLRERWLPRKPEPFVRRLTADAGLNTAPVLSRDGSTLAFASDRGGEGNLDIWVQQIGSGRPVRLTREPEDETDPDISPDGSRVAYRSERAGGGIYVAPVLGGEPMLVANGGRNPRFSPDGKRIAFWKGRESPAYVPGSAGVFIAGAGGGEAHAVHGQFAAALYPVWSPKGDELLVLGRRDGSRPLEESLDWWILGAAGGSAKKTGALRLLAEQKLLYLTGQQQFVPLSWHGPGFEGKVLFAASKGDSSNLWEIRISPAGRAEGNAARVTGGTGREMFASPAASVDGVRLAYASLNIDFDIWELPLDEESGKPRGGMKRVTEDASSDLFPSLSADGDTLAYLERRLGIWTLRTRSFATGRQTAALSTNTELTYPKISRDGTRLSYADLDGNIWQVGIQGGTAERLCSACGSPSDSSADGARVLVEPFDTPEAIHGLDARSKSVTTIAPSAGRLLGARLSQDEKWLAFHRIEDGKPNPRIFIAPMQGAKAAAPDRWTAVTAGEAVDRDPRWSPAAGVLYFTSDRDGFRCLWAQRLDAASKRPAGGPFPVVHLHHARFSLRAIANLGDAIGMSVARGRVVFALGELTGNAWMQIRER